MTNTPQLDAASRAILGVLQAEGRLSVQDLAARVGLSATPVARRLRALEDSGLIAGYAARIDEQRAGYPFSVFISVKLNSQIDDVMQRFESAIQSFPEVVDCWLMTGNRDYLLRVATTGLAEFETLLTGRLTKIPGVQTIESSIPLRRVKDGMARLP